MRCSMCRVLTQPRLPLTPDEAENAMKVRSANTLRGYQSNWNEFTSWCMAHSFDSMPAEALPQTGTRQAKLLDSGGCTNSNGPRCSGSHA